MSLNVILPNLSLAFSSVTFYQVARILLTPCVALMNFVLYQATLPRAALLALIPACAGVGMVSYYDSLPAADASVKTTSGLGVIFAFTGIFASSLYTVWIGAYHRKLQMSSMQLLFNQAPVSAFMLLYVIPFVDTFPVWSEVPINRWAMIFLVSLSSLSNRLLALKESRSGLTELPVLVRRFCCTDQHFTILHHRANRSRFKYRGWPRQDVYNCRVGLDDFGESNRRQVRLGGFCGHWGHHCILNRHAQGEQEEASPRWEISSL